MWISETNTIGASGIIGTERYEIPRKVFKPVLRDDEGMKNKPKPKKLYKHTEKLNVAFKNSRLIFYSFIQKKTNNRRTKRIFYLLSWPRKIGWNHETECIKQAVLIVWNGEGDENKMGRNNLQGN